MAVVQLPFASVSLSMQRLTIVDQTELPVPYSFPYLGVTLAFNGEIYNWKQLRAELSDGTPWLTSCDSEVLARAWQKWGPACQDHFNGMWALVLVDAVNRSIFVSRDRAGKKPLFYVKCHERLYITSEAKALPVRLSAGPCTDMEMLEFVFD